MDDIHYTLKNCYGDEVSCIYNDYNSDNLIFRIRLTVIKKKGKNKIDTLDESDEIHILKKFSRSIVK